MRGIHITDWYTIKRYDDYYSVENRETKDKVRIFGQSKREIKISTYSYLVGKYGSRSKVSKRYLKRNW